MFKALYGFFNFIFLLILFKMFAPGLFDLTLQILTNFLVIINQVVLNLAQHSVNVSDTFPM